MRRLVFPGVLLGLCCFSVDMALAGGGATYSVSSDATAAGGTVNLTATLDNDGGDISGWSWGLCHDELVATVSNIGDGGGAANSTSTVSNGDPASFNETSIYPGGFTQGVVIDFIGCCVVAGGTTGFLMATADYTVAGGVAPGDYSVEYCGGVLGAPPVANVVVVNGGSIPPAGENSGTITVVDVPDPEWNYLGGNSSGNHYPAGTGIGGLTVLVGFSIQEKDNSSQGASFPNATQGFSMGCGNDGSLVIPTAGSTSLGFEPDFAEFNFYPDAWILGVVYSFSGSQLALFDVTTEVISVAYDGVATALAGVEGATSTALVWNNSTGSPPVSNVVVFDSGGYSPNFIEGSIEFVGTVTNAFQRGDSNDDGVVNIADIIWMLSEMFGGRGFTDCAIADDSNADGMNDAADAVYTATYVFLEGPAPAAPFGSCGATAGQTPADCVSFNSCP
ncbi:MAG: hypothetical protein HN891_06660 [Planctomycetes bacterium]|jgi:hypothetical protein|nr:hypothetical protein [Planctomycetota bacterium]MBT6452948.1 hypothetical protein [Planctomycetota bacterium]MBT6783618.1 hypothetical protein [Planctomycetota bacterium]MBT6969251.1 hypothetical protein [Planctomycetota bacterium]MBT7104797.1 hypothetical protein [Planctomycetota bacterium]